MRRSLALVLAIAFQLPTIFSAAPAHAAVNANIFGALQWRNIGPLRAGRAITVDGVPSDPDTFYFGAVGGGVWVTHNAGRTWRPIFDSQPVASIGAVAVAPSDPNVIYVGSGEADMRSDIQHGDGMYKSVDGGKTWSHIGLEDTRQIGRVVVDPKDPNVVYVAALGHQYAPNAERGVFKSTDGGKTWSKVLYKDENTGAIDLAMDPADSSVLFASLWQTRRPPWNVYPPSNGPGSGLYESTDAGKTWTHITGHGFPGGVLGHIGIAIAANHHRIYTIVDTNEEKTGGVYRSDDGGATWTHTDGEGRIWKRGWYFGQITADPKNADEVYVMNTSTYRSTDAGKSFTAIKGAPGGDDYHAMWINPNDPNRIVLGGDQGVVVSVDGAKTWSSWYNQSTAQLYHVVTDNRFPYWVYGAQQDSGAVAVPSRSIHTNISAYDWRPIDAGGESGTIAADPEHPAHVYGSAPGTYENVDTNWEMTIDPTLKYPDTVWRNTWTLPIVASPQNPRVLYMSHQRIFRSADAGRTWHLMSPDLTRPANTVPRNLDPATVADSTGLPRRGVVYWIAPSPARAHELWAGTDDGLIWITRDEGAHWQNVTPPGLTPWSKVGIIDASHFDAQTAYAAIDRHRLDDNRPYIYKTHDGGKTWASIVSGIPANESVNVVREDPKRRGLLYAGTERHVYVSFDDGAQWQPLQLNLPAASMRDIVFNGDDVILATHGRGIWILDNASPLRQISTQVAQSSAHLFKPAAAYRTRPGSDEGTPLPPEEPALPNPPNGAMIDYYVGSANTPLVIQITDASGRTVRQWSSSDKPVTVNPKSLDIPMYWVHPQLPPSAQPGAHRWIWDLHYAGTGRDRLARGGGPLAPPGAYTVHLRVNGKAFAQTLVLRRDPTYPASDADLRAQFQLAERIDAESVSVKAALAHAQSLLKTHPKLRAIVGQAPPTTPDDSVGKPAQDFGSLRYIGDALQALDAAVESADVRPTPDQYAAFATLKHKADNAMRALVGLH
ncbi:MAG TPA: hypothetical protein VJP85_07435 [Candidatus Baltobacteraceae bacterium]|nr:hypothetical protein [Candidatus Baltobacteraceae bacterium]